MTSETKHTPGPWKVDRTGKFHGQRPYGISANDGTTITRWGSISRPASLEAEANARLIAAAPEMLDLIQRMISAIDAGSVDSEEIDLGDGTQPHRFHEEWAHYARAAISKATGEGE